MAWSGMRGVVSLASALAIPLTLSDGSLFPHRNLILFITFVVILITLVFQGLSLPWLIRFLKIEVSDEEEKEQEISIRLRLAGAVLEHMENNYSEEITSIDAYIRVKERYDRIVEITSRKLLQQEGDIAIPSFLPKYRQMLLELVGCAAGRTTETASGETVFG